MTGKAGDFKSATAVVKKVIRASASVLAKKVEPFRLFDATIRTVTHETDTLKV